MTHNIQSILAWLKNRCLFRYKETNDSTTIFYINSLSNIIENLQQCSIDESNLDLILSKYYFDFNMDKSTNIDGFSIGFSENDRISLRKNITNIYKDIINNLNRSNTETVPLNTNEIVDSQAFDNEKILDLISNHTDK